MTSKIKIPTIRLGNQGMLPRNPDDGRRLIVDKAACLVNQYWNLARAMRDNSTNSSLDEEKLRALVHDCRIIGETAAFFGGYQAMLEMNNAIVDAGGDSRSINYLWDGICGWIP